ncbi:hypothetical protein RHSP_00552 [Rhizobium freirei PRF 81]|nr:hypothetical protein RTCIAT899_PB00820 [Rhizobium tropici CIAT 899]AYG70734.1 hypothetical protein CCGE531_30490 [Rhizobium sp. CCGE531]AYG77065.1 hypothetical protein CCGE532_30085 [Rhizobium sp. CCGE532]ENN88322.1 hypothetical protein RHSP_00552 [Rhizobium freirei PRF 81]NEV15212.1 hypothetical protein [Rhizobium tropici]TGE92812.1 hypothetical protein C9417_27725 [Rhizobium sp. SEMIA 4088]SCB49311.1 hypothetical protein GA0061101_13013 [Rhizobium lusitanum]
MTVAYLQITLQIAAANRRAAIGIYQKYKETFLTDIGATSKELLIRDDDVQVLHGFNSVEDAGPISKANSSTTTTSPIEAAAGGSAGHSDLRHRLNCSEHNIQITR